MAVEAELYNNGDFVGFDVFQEQQQMMTWQQQQQQGLGFGFQTMVFYQNGVSSSSSSLSGGADVATTMGFSGSLASFIENQNQEIDCAIQVQNEMLRRTLQESSTQHLSILLQKYQPYITALISEKDQIISTANKKTLILENYLSNMEQEIDAWQTKARESEAQVAGLNNALSQIIERINGGDEESCCERESTPSNGNRCRICRARRSCVVILPCRHLCSCEFCEGFVGVCPVCATVKEYSIEVLLD